MRNFSLFLSLTKLISLSLYINNRDVYNQIVSIVTLSHMNAIYEKRNNYDLRKLLAGSERLVDSLLKNETHKKISNNPFVPLTHSVRILPMESSIRDNITSTIQSNCSKIKNLVFAVLLANNKLITMVRMKNYSMHTDDLRIIFNLVECTESFKSAEVSLTLQLIKLRPIDDSSSRFFCFSVRVGHLSVYPNLTPMDSFMLMFLISLMIVKLVYFCSLSIANLFLHFLTQKRTSLIN